MNEINDGGWFAGAEHAAFDLEPESSPTRGAVLLLHGFGGTPAELRPLAEALVPRGLSRVRAAAARFRSDRHQLATVSASDWLAAASAARSEVSTRHAHTVLMGYSMGGALALHLGVTRPPGRLILVAPLWRLLGAAWPLGAALPVLRHVIRDVPTIRSEAALAEPELRRFITCAAPELDLNAPATRHELRRRMRLPTSGIAHLWRLAITSGDAAPRVHAPTLVVQGVGDTVVRTRDTRRLAQRFGGPIELHEVNAGHLVLEQHADAWGEVRQLIVGFAEPMDKGSTKA
jgi:carboxylesterase